MKIASCMKRNVYSIAANATLGEAAAKLVAHHIGLLPVVDEQMRPVGVVGLKDLLDLGMPDFVRLIQDLDFVHEFGAVESFIPNPETLARPVTTKMRQVRVVKEDCGLLRAIATMLQYDLHDLPVVSEDGRLTGIASRVDIGTAILSAWQAGSG